MRTANDAMNLMPGKQPLASSKATLGYQMHDDVGFVDQSEARMQDCGLDEEKLLSQREKI